MITEILLKRKGLIAALAGAGAGYSLSLIPGSFYNFALDHVAAIVSAIGGAYGLWLEYKEFVKNRPGTAEEIPSHSKYDENAHTQHHTPGQGETGGQEVVKL